MLPLWQIAVPVFLFIWIVFLTFLVLRLYRLFKSLSSPSPRGDLVQTLEKILSDQTCLSRDIAEIRSQIAGILLDAKSHFQHLGFVKFNPFPNTGGDQSFVLTLLDDHQDGLVLTSLHSREGTRFYAKKITRGQAPQDLSREEKQALSEALINQKP